MQRTWTDDEGLDWSVRREDGRVVFRHGSRRLVATTESAGGDRGSLDDSELRDLFRDATSEVVTGDDSPPSPSAVGRETSPHLDPAEHGSGGSE